MTGERRFYEDAADVNALTLQRLPLDASTWSANCAGPSALHQGFNSLLVAVQLGAGTAVSSDRTRAEEVQAHLSKHSGGVEPDARAELAHEGHAHAAHSLLVMAAGAGGVAPSSASGRIKHLAPFAASASSFRSSAVPAHKMELM